jgi:hypothetical protein
MAPKKSKNAIVDRGVVKSLVGTPVRIIALGGSHYSCPRCSKSVRNAVMFRIPAGDYCSRSCAAAVVASETAASA